MSAAFKCDRCDKLYIQPRRGAIYEGIDGGRIIDSVEIRVWGIEKDFDICPDCSVELRKFLGIDRTCLH